jgi:ribosome-associated protein
MTSPESSRTPGGDLVIAAGPGMPRGLRIPAAELVERFSHSSGPGGQSVNTTDSRVELLFVPATSSAFSDGQRARVLRNLADRLSNAALTIAAAEYRSQYRNRVAARERLTAILREAIAPPAPQRRPTKPTRGSQRRRLEQKKQRGQTKALRGRVGPDA